MMAQRRGHDQMPPPPAARLRERLLEQVESRERSGDAEGAAALRDIAESWWKEQEAWLAGIRDVLSAHHEINNALVGVRGNAQLVLKDPACRGPEARERLEVVLRESSRIQEATARIRDLKAVLGAPAPRSRAA